MSKQKIKGFDDALLDLFKEWAALLAEPLDGTGIGPQAWDRHFMHHIASRVPRLKKTRDYRRLTQRLDVLASRVPTMAKFRATQTR